MKDQLPTLLVGALVVVVLYFVFQKRNDTATVTNFQLDQLRTEMKEQLQREHDSIVTLLSSPVEIDNSKSDSLQQVAIDLNNKTLYELRKKNNARIDTVSGTELRSIFAEYRRQYDMSTH